MDRSGPSINAESVEDRQVHEDHVRGMVQTPSDQPVIPLFVFRIMAVP